MSPSVSFKKFKFFCEQNFDILKFAQKYVTSNQFKFEKECIICNILEETCWGWVGGEVKNKTNLSHAIASLLGLSLAISRNPTYLELSEL